MTNEDDPYLNLIKVMRTQGEINNPTPFFVGEIKTVSPLTVQVADIIIEREDILINDFLLTGYKRKLKLDATNATGVTASKGGGSGYAEYQSHEHDISTIGIGDGTYTTLDDFTAGDKVLMLMSADQQQFILVCKLK